MKFRVLKFCVWEFQRNEILSFATARNDFLRYEILPFGFSAFREDTLSSNKKGSENAIHFYPLI